MWRSLWRSIDRFSLPYFRYIINELREIKVVDKHNRELVVDLLQSVVEIVTYGDRHDPSIFECFMEFQVLAVFVRILKIGGNSRIEAPLLQYLSIMIQNMENEQAIYYCLSNGYINSIITHQYDFDGGDLIPYYVSFLRAVSGKIDRDTICLLVKVHQDAIVSFPLYDEALKFAHHGEKMIQIAVCALTLNIYNVGDEMVCRFLTTPPVSEYFSGLILNLKEKCFHIDALIRENCRGRKRELLLETDRIVDDFYYLKDILCIPEHQLSKLVTESIVNLLILPMLLTLLRVRQINDTGLSAVTCLYVLCRLLQVFDGTNLVNVVGSALLFSCMPLSMTDAAKSVASVRLNQVNSSAIHCHETEEMVNLQCKGLENFMRNYLLEHSSEYVELSSCFGCLPQDNTQNEWDGILHCIFSSNHSLMLASLMLLFIVAESKDLDQHLVAMIGFSQVKTASEVNGSILARQIQKIVNKLLEVLASNPPVSIATLLHTAWFLRKLLVFLDQKLDDYDHHLFKTSYELSCGRLGEEFNQCWFDYIPDTLRTEWASCKRYDPTILFPDIGPDSFMEFFSLFCEAIVLEESSHSKDPFFILELASDQIAPSGKENSAFDWQQTIDVVKVFILHLQLKPFIFGGDPFDNPLKILKNSSMTQSGKRYASDISLASFGSEVALASGIPCKIAFSGAGTRDIFVIPIAREISGKLLLVEQHPLHSRRGVVIAIAPLAGLNPTIDENHPTWLHLKLRDFEPTLHSSETRRLDSNTSINGAQGRWTLGFPNAEVCKTAYSVILEETGKQRSFAESLVAPLLENNFSRKF